MRENLPEQIGEDTAQKLFRLHYTSVIFAAASLEAYINHYGRIHAQSKTWFDDNLADLDVRWKWKIFPKLFASGYFPTGGKGWNSLTALITLRNELVHNKPIVLDFLEEGEPVHTFDERADVFRKHVRKFIGKLNAVDPINAVVEILDDLRSVDPDADINWINDVFHDDL